MVSLKRWHEAQEYERGYWTSQALQLADGTLPQLSWYEWRAQRLIDRLTSLGLNHLVDGKANVVEVGSGPVGIVAFLQAAERRAIDPLADFYAANTDLTLLRNPDVEYVNGTGERLPYDSGRYGLVIMENCIDHVQNVDAVMSEIHRVLEPAGVLYLTVNSRTPLGFLVHRGLSRMRIDAGHPHTFTPDRARALVRSSGFRLLSCEAGSYWEAFRTDLRGSGLRPRMKAALGTSEFVVSIIAQRADLP